MSVCSSGGGSVLLACVVASARHKPPAWVSKLWFGNNIAGHFVRLPYCVCLCDASAPYPGLAESGGHD